MNKKIPKRLLAVAMAAMTAVTVSVPAFAENSIVNTPSNNEVQVQSSIASNFTVTIPKAVVLTKASGGGTGEYTAAFDATVTGDIGELETVYVTPDASVTLTGDKAGATTVATTTIGTTEFARAAILGQTATGTHNLTAQLTPGAWSGTMNVTISLKSVAAPKLGDKVTIGDYEYCYGMRNNGGGAWYNPTDENAPALDGWGVRVLNSSKSSYGTLETSINGKPVSNLDYLFAGTTSPTLDLSAVKTDNAVSMRGMFSHAAATTIDISGFNTKNVTNMGSMFSSVNIAGALDLTHLNVSKVTDMNAMFARANIPSLDVSTWDTSNVTDMTLMFSFSAIPTVDITGLNVSNVTSMRGMFLNFKGTTINLSGLNAAKLTNVGAMFNVSLATTINMTGFTANSITNTSQMFASTKATTLDLSGISMAGVASTDVMFSGAAATVGYGKTVEDCAKLNAISGKPAGLTFVVKA